MRRILHVPQGRLPMTRKKPVTRKPKRCWVAWHGTRPCYRTPPWSCVPRPGDECDDSTHQQPPEWKWMREAIYGD